MRALQPARDKNVMTEGLITKKSRPADMCGWTGHNQGNLALRVCEPLCGECAVQR